MIAVVLVTRLFGPERFSVVSVTVMNWSAELANVEPG